MTHADSPSLHRDSAKDHAALLHAQASPLTRGMKRHALDFAAAADRGTIWPIHRIRCFLLAQQEAGSPRTTR